MSQPGAEGHDELRPSWAPEVLPAAWVIEEDESFLALNKPAGIPLLPLDKQGWDLLSRVRRERGPELRTVPQLEQAASGVVVFAKSKSAMTTLSQAIEGRDRVTREYTAIIDPSELPTSIRYQDRRGQSLVVEIQKLRVGPIGHQLRIQIVGGAPSSLREVLDRRGASIVEGHRLMLHLARLAVNLGGGVREFSAPVASELRAAMDGRRSLLSQRIGQALQRRLGLFEAPDTDAFRLVHGAGDDVRGVELDCYGPYAVLHLHDGETHDDEQALVDEVCSLGFRGVYLKRRPKNASALASQDRRDRAPDAPVWGQAAPHCFTILEHGVRYPVWLGEGLSTGIFLDQRCNRQRLRRASDGRRVLNLFGYAGAFSRAAQVGHATRTVTVDLSKRALAKARLSLGEGAEEDQLAASHELLAADVFAWLRGPTGFRKASEPFDVIVCDPPTFARSKGSRWTSGRGWIALTKLVLGRMDARGGWALFCSNDRRLTPAAFEKYVSQAADRVFAQKGSGYRRRLTLERHPPPVDFPPDPGRGPHLKTVVLRVEQVG